MEHYLEELLDSRQLDDDDETDDAFETVTA